MKDLMDRIMNKNSELPQAKETPSGWRGEITNLMLERVCVPQSFNGFIGLE